MDSDRQDFHSATKIVMGQQVLDPAHKTVPSFKISKKLIKKALKMQSFYEESKATDRIPKNDVFVRTDGTIILKT